MRNGSTSKHRYDLRIHEVCKNISENGYKRVLLQFPEGLKYLASEVKDEIEERTKASVIISADPCYGACDIPFYMDDLGIELLVQFGHAEIPNIECTVPTMFIEAYSNLDVMPVVKKALEQLKGSVGLITTPQHIHKLKEVKSFLSENGFKALIGKGVGRIVHEGQVLGCNLSSATSISSDVEGYLYIGSGNFHAIGVALATNKPVVVADPYANEVRDIVEEKNKMIRQRHGAIARAENAKIFGILVTAKPGQTRISLAIELKRLVEKHGKKAVILVLHDIEPIKLKPFYFDALVSTACPRIAIDDYLIYDVPILTPQELKIVLGEGSWDDYKLDELV